MSFINIHKKNYLEKGTMLLPYDNSDYPLTKENVQELQKLCY